MIWKVLRWFAVTVVAADIALSAVALIVFITEVVKDWLNK